MLDVSGLRGVEGVVRALATAAKSLRLYPQTSPIPSETVESARTLLAEYFETGESALRLRIVRDGFIHGSERLSMGTAGVSDLVTELHDHGLAEIVILPGCSTQELLAFLRAAGDDAESVRAQGGLAAVLAVEGVESIRVTDVQLTVVTREQPDSGVDVDEFLARLAGDPARLSAWYAAAAAGDPHTFEEGLAELARVSGPGGLEAMHRALADAFKSQESIGKDALLWLAVEQGPAREIAAGMFRFLEPDDIASAILEGSFGKTMLSVSTALTHLPLEQVRATVHARIQAMLPGTGHTDKEARFLEHMIQVRRRVEPEPALVDTADAYRRSLEFATLTPDALGRAYDLVNRSAATISASSVRTMAVLLSEQHDFALLCEGVDSLAAMVPRLVGQGDLELAEEVLADLSARAASTGGQWPELPMRLSEALAAATGPETMGAAIRLVAQDASRAEVARRMARHGGGTAVRALVEAAVEADGPGLEVAESLMGHRVVDVLRDMALKVPWIHLRPVVARLAREGDSRTVSTLEALLRRPDAQSRREVAAGLGDSRGPAALRLLGAVLRDPSSEVAIIAARGIGRDGRQGSAAVLGARLAELDIDNGDFLLGREIIGALAHVKDPAADEVLRRLAGRRALIKRGHFSDVQQLAASAIKARKGGTG